jgi:AcrR family transcriptional regulator
MLRRYLSVGIYSHCNRCRYHERVQTRSNATREDGRHLRRDRIAAAAMELFAVRGFDAVSVAAVASAAGVTEKTVFNHFSTKEDLVYSSDRVFEERLIGAVRERAAGSSVHHAVATFLLDLYAGFPNDPTRLVRHQRLSRLVSASPALQSRERLILARYAKALQEVIATEQGAAAEDLRPRLAAETLMAAHGAVIGAFRSFALGGHRPEEYVPKVVRAAEQVFRTLINGFGDYATKLPL